MVRATSAAIAVGLYTLLGASGLPAAADQPTGSITMAVALDGVPVAGHTVIVDPAQPVTMTLSVHNNTDDPTSVHAVRLTGTALALTFFEYDTTVPFDVAAHSTTTRTLPLDLSDLDNQAIGLIPASVEVLDPQKNTVAAVNTVTDVHGSLGSVYGVFGIAVLILTILAWSAALLAMARRRLPANRWRRALRFLPAGFGTGIIAVITLSVFRMVAPVPTVELPVIGATVLAALVLGYLTPNPVTPDTSPDPAGEPPTLRVTRALADEEGLSR